MKTVKVIAKIVAVLAAVAGVVYIVATYGDKIVAWAKRMLGCCHSGDTECVESTCFETIKDAAPAEEAPVEEPAADSTEEETVVASDADFEG